MTRLPPQPANTAMARFVRRVIDAMPWVMAKNLAESRSKVRRMAATIEGLLNERTDLRHNVHHLRRDYRNLVSKFDHARPVPVDVKLDVLDEQASMDTVLRIRTDYQPMVMNVALSSWDQRRSTISEVGRAALSEAATEIARQCVPVHRDHLISLALRGRTFDEVIDPPKPKKGKPNA